MKKEFTTERWEKALTAVFVKSISDLEYRQLCLTNARAAVAVVAPYLELPYDFHFKFAASQADLLYSYQLPPVLEEGVDTAEYAAMLIEQDANGKTHPPTDTNQTPSDPQHPHGGDKPKGSDR